MSTVGEKMVLLPSSHFQRLQNFEQDQQQRTSKRDIIDAVKRPEEQELVKVYTRMENVLADGTKSEHEKAAEHAEALNELGVLRDRVFNRRDALLSTLKPSAATSSSSTGATHAGQQDAVVEGTVEMMPKSLQRHARQLMRRLHENGNVVSWSPSGEVTIGGQRLAGSNIADLVGDVLRARKIGEVPGRERFLRALAEINAPEELVRNKGALARYRTIKALSSLQSQTQTFQHPPGIPGQRKRRLLPKRVDVYEGSDDNDDDTRKRELKRARHIK